MASRKKAAATTYRCGCETRKHGEKLPRTGPVACSAFGVIPDSVPRFRDDNRDGSSRICPLLRAFPVRALAFDIGAQDGVDAGMDILALHAEPVDDLRIETKSNESAVSGGIDGRGRTPEGRPQRRPGGRVVLAEVRQTRQLLEGPLHGRSLRRHDPLSRLKECVCARRAGSTTPPSQSHATGRWR
jgi:hypothetical protein